MPLCRSRSSSLRRSRPGSWLLAAVVILAAGACGGDDDSAATSTPAATATTTSVAEQPAPTDAGPTSTVASQVERTASITIAGTDYELEVTECLLASLGSGPGAEGYWPDQTNPKVFAAISGGGISDDTFKVQNAVDFDATDGVEGLGGPKEVFDAPLDELTYDSDGEVATYTGTDISMESNQGRDPIVVDAVTFSCQDIG